MTFWQPYIIASVIGLLVGMEREKSHGPTETLGVRTFVLVSVLGAVSGGMKNPWLSLLIAAFALGLILISYFNQTKTMSTQVDRGLTTEFAAGIIFCLGFAAHQSPTLAATIGIMVAVLLISKRSFHTFSHKIKHSELQAALLLLLGGILVVGVAPDKSVDTWGIFNPRKFGYLIVTLASLEFSSYVLTKIIGEKKGAIVFGFLGGFVSSTAILLSSAKQSAKYPDRWRTNLSSALAATLASLIELLLIVAIISQELFLHILVPIGSGIILGVIFLFFLSRKIANENFTHALKTPLDWKGVFRLSILLGAILAAISITQLWLGDQAALIVSFITGFFELHGVSMANATLFRQGKLLLQSAVMSVLIATIGSLLAKIGISWFVNRGAFARNLTFFLAPMIGVIGVLFWAFAH